MGSLLALAGRGYSCGEVRDMALTQAGRLRARIADLRRTERRLRQVAAHCPGGRAPDCPVIDGLLARPG